MSNRDTIEATLKMYGGDEIDGLSRLQLDKKVTKHFLKDAGITSPSKIRPGHVFYSNTCKYTFLRKFDERQKNRLPNRPLNRKTNQLMYISERLKTGVKQICRTSPGNLFNRKYNRIGIPLTEKELSDLNKEHTLASYLPYPLVSLDKTHELGVMYQLDPTCDAAAWYKSPDQPPTFYISNIQPRNSL